MITDVLTATSDAGETFATVSLRRGGIYVQNLKVEAALMAVDPINRELRAHALIVRRNYNVQSPTALW